MTKAQLVAKLAEGGGVSRKQADDILNSLIDTVVKSVKKGESVKIPGLGIFRLRKMKARMGRNPATGEEILTEEELVRRAGDVGPSPREVVIATHVGERTQDGGIPDVRGSIRGDVKLGLAIERNGVGCGG